jgi:hypothetical protein
MGVRFQVVIDCAEPEPLARFWATALGYVLEPPPAGFAIWDDYYRHIGLPDSFLGHGTDHIIDPTGSGPRFWFQRVPDVKTVKNRLHLDVRASGGQEAPIATRIERVNAEARRLASLGATILSELREKQDEGIDHYAVAMKDPEGNEFDIN